MGAVLVTNREWLTSLTNEKLAEWLSSHYIHCEYCYNRNDCSPTDYVECYGIPSTYLAWLKAEHKEEQ